MVRMNIGEIHELASGKTTMTELQERDARACLARRYGARPQWLPHFTPPGKIQLFRDRFGRLVKRTRQDLATAIAVHWEDVGENGLAERFRELAMELGAPDPPRVVRVTAPVTETEPRHVAVAVETTDGEVGGAVRDNTTAPVDDDEGGGVALLSTEIEEDPDDHEEVDGQPDTAKAGSCTRCNALQKRVLVPRPVFRPHRQHVAGAHVVEVAERQPATAARTRQAAVAGNRLDPAMRAAAHCTRGCSARRTA